MDVDTARLRAFLHVAERGTVAAAADALGYTAPAVSQQISKLELQLDTRLFDRVAGRLRLSPSGHRLLPLARQMLDLLSESERVGDGAPAGRQIVIAGFASAINAFVVPLLPDWRRTNDSFEVVEAEDQEALRDLGLGQVDVALVQEYDGVSNERTERFTYVPLHRDRLRLLAPPSYQRTVRLATLAETAWLVNGTGTRCEEATEAILHDAGIVPNITGRVTDNDTLLSLVAAGHGSAIAPELVVREARADITVARADLGASRTILAVTRTAVAAHVADIVDQLRATRIRPT